MELQILLYALTQAAKIEFIKPRVIDKFTNSLNFIVFQHLFSLFFSDLLRFLSHAFDQNIKLINTYHWYYLIGKLDDISLLNRLELILFRLKFTWAANQLRFYFRNQLSYTLRNLLALKTIYWLIQWFCIACLHKVLLPRF